MHVLIYSICLLQSILIVHLKFKKWDIFKIYIVAILFALFSANIESGKLIDRSAYDYMFLYRFPSENKTLLSVFNSTIEPAYIILNQVINRFTQSTFWLYFITTFFMVFIDTFTIKKISPRYKLTIVFYLLSFQVFFGTFLLRQGLAAALVNFSFLMYRYKRKITAIIFIILAMSFHATAVIMLPIYLVLFISKSIKMRMIWFLLIVSIILFIFYDSVIQIIFNIGFISENFGSYQGVNLKSGYMIVLKGVPYHLITIFSLLERKRILNKLKNAEIYFGLVIMNSLFWIFSMRMYWFWRLSMFTIVPSLILMTYTFEATDNRYKSIFYRVSISTFMLLITIREIIITLY